MFCPNETIFALLIVSIHYTLNYLALNYLELFQSLMKNPKTESINRPVQV